MPDSLLLYGASGYTGKLIARAAQERGLDPILCGRSEEAIRSLAADLGLEHRVSDLRDPRALDRAFDGVSVVINAAGPFTDTAGPIVDACIRNGVHYLDVTGEFAVLESVRRKNAEARPRDVMLMPAVGFDVVASDCLVAHVARRTGPGALRVHIGLSGLSLLSRGSALTYVRTVGDPVWVRRDGALVRIPAASLERTFDFGAGPRRSVVWTWGDVCSAYYTTGIPDITVFCEETPVVQAHSAMLRLFGWAVPFTPWRDWLSSLASLMPEGPAEQERTERQAVVAVDVEDAGGRLVRSLLRTPEPYTCTALTAVAVAAFVTAGDWEPGFQTPARVYGPDFVLSLPGVSRVDL